MKYTTYFLGAGASAYALPTITDLPEAFQKISKYILQEVQKKPISSQLNNQNITKEIKELAEDIKSLGEYSIEYGTIDTYFKKLYLNKEVVETKRLKRAMSYFFYLWQNCGCEFDRNKEEKWKRIDLRYLALLSNILEPSDSEPTWNERFKIVTWNYDYQIIASLNNLSNKEIKNIVKDYKVFPLNHLLKSDCEQSNIVYLNGISGTFNFENQVDIRFEENYCTPVENIYELYSDFLETEGDDNQDFINFAWEQGSNEISRKAIQQAEAIFRNTDKLVIVGYSFPQYNYEVDKAIFSNLRANTKILYQDFNAEAESFLEKFNFSASKVKLKVFTDKKSNKQFLIPN